MATLKQKAVLKKIHENPRKSISGAMRESGYSPATATKPSDLTNSKGWQELMEEYFPDKDLANIHKELLHSNFLDEIDFPDTMPDSEIKEVLEGITGARLKMIKSINVPFKGNLKRALVILPFPKARTAALDLAYKLQGKFAPEKVIDPESQRKLDEIRQEMKDFIGAK